jgi:hypothetical protein
MVKIRRLRAGVRLRLPFVGPDDAEVVWCPDPRFLVFGVALELVYDSSGSCG